MITCFIILLKSILWRQHYSHCEYAKDQYWQTSLISFCLIQKGFTGQKSFYACLLKAKLNINFTTNMNRIKIDITRLSLVVFIYRVHGWVNICKDLHCIVIKWHTEKLNCWRELSVLFLLFLMSQSWKLSIYFFLIYIMSRQTKLTFIQSLLATICVI